MVEHIALLESVSLALTPINREVACRVGYTRRTPLLILLTKSVGKSPRRPRSGAESGPAYDSDQATVSDDTHVYITREL